MTIYEQVQQAVDFVENHLDEKLPVRRVADAAYMSLRSLQNHFPAVTGMTCGEYVIRRRLAEALCRLDNPGPTILQVALDSGYESHEAFTRAFTREFGGSPTELRGRTRPRGFQERISLVKEMYMGVIEKKLSDNRVRIFDGFGENCEAAATRAMEQWLAVDGGHLGPRRIFGHNIDTEGRHCGPEHDGYRFLVTLPESWSGTSDGVLTGGRFIITGIEGSFDEDPEGRWIGDGWDRLNVMMRDKGLKPHPSGRWYEEHLEAVNPGRVRLDLYVEVE